MISSRERMSGGTRILKSQQVWKSWEKSSECKTSKGQSEPEVVRNARVELAARVDQRRSAHARSAPAGARAPTWWARVLRGGTRHSCQSGDGGGSGSGDGARARVRRTVRRIGIAREAEELLDALEGRVARVNLCVFLTRKSKNRVKFYIFIRVIELWYNAINSSALARYILYYSNFACNEGTGIHTCAGVRRPSGRRLASYSISRTSLSIPLTSNSCSRSSYNDF